jgi:DUF218 domain
VRPNLIRRAKHYRVGEDKMAANPFTRGTCPGRARPPHRGSFARGHAKRGGRQKGTPNAISPRARKAIAAAAKRLARGAPRNRYRWQRVINKNPLITAARDGQFTLAGAPRLRSRPFTMKSFCQDLSAVAMRAIQTDQFVEQDLVECLMLLAVRDPTEFAKFLALTPPKESYLAARPDAASSCSRAVPGRRLLRYQNSARNIRTHGWLCAGLGRGPELGQATCRRRDRCCTHYYSVPITDDCRGRALLGRATQTKADESWLLITAATHMPRAVGCFRAAGFQLQPYPVEFMTRGRTGPFALFATGSSALMQLDRAAKEWIGFIAYRLMGKTDALFPGREGSPPRP